jgi:hypothetical protein
MPTPTLPISTLATTNTFRDWLTRTNTIIDLINSGSLLVGTAANGAPMGAFTIGNTVDTTSSLSVAGDKFFANATGMYLTGISTFGANLTVNSSASNTVIASAQTYLISARTLISGANLVVNAAATFNGSVTLSSSSPLTVSGNAIFNANVTIGANVSLNSGVSANGVLGTAGQFLTSNGTGVYWSTFTIADANSSTSGLVNTSAQTLAGAKTFTGAMNLSSTLGITGATNALSTLGVTGAANLLSTLGVTGAANLLSTLGVTGAANLLSTLGVTGTTTLAGSLIVNGSSTVNAAMSVNAALTMANNTVLTPTGIQETTIVLGVLGSTQTLNIANGTTVTATLSTGATAFTLPSPASGKSFLMYLTQNGTPTGTATWATPSGNLKWPNNGSAPTITTTANRVDIFSFASDGTNWYASYVQNY